MVFAQLRWKVDSEEKKNVEDWKVWVRCDGVNANKALAMSEQVSVVTQPLAKISKNNAL